MLTNDAKIDDFKTDRKGITPPLPMVMRLVPLLFYLSLLFLVVVGTVSSIHAKFSSDHRSTLLGRIETLKKEIEEVKKEKTALENEIKEATDLEAWVLASIPLQPLVVSIIRSMGSQSEIVDFTLERDAETPSQLRVGLKLNTASDKQIEQTLEVVRGMNYREFNPTQTRVQGNLDYKASLLWQDPQGKRQTPEERKAQAGAVP
jgi:cell division protein FtsB